MRIIASCFSHYIGDVYHSYLNALYFANQYGDAVLADPEYISRPLEYSPATLQLYGDIRISEQEKSKIPHFFVPAELLQEQHQSHCRTQEVLAEQTQPLPAVQKTLTEQIDAYLNTSGKGIEGLFVYGQPPCYLQAVAEHYHVSMTVIEHSTVRTPSGYSANLLYAASQKLYGSDECERRYRAFMNDPPEQMLDRRELLAFFCSKELHCLIPALRCKGKYEFGHACGLGVFWAGFCADQYTDPDIQKEALNVWPPHEIYSRKHPADAPMLQEAFQSKESPVEFLLKCRRIGAAASNMLFEAMLWNRTAYTRGKAMPFSFMCETDAASDTLAPESFLNFFLFCFLIPEMDCLLDPLYWNWRAQNPSEKEIFQKHHSILSQKLGMPPQLLSRAPDSRFHTILASRGCTSLEIEQIEKDWKRPDTDWVCFDVLRSRIGIRDPKGNLIAEHWCLNHGSEGTISSYFPIALGNINNFFFVPLGDRCGYVRIQDIRIGGISAFSPEGQKACAVYGCLQGEMRFFPKMDIIAVQFSDSRMPAEGIEILWQYQDITNDYLKAQSDRVSLAISQVQLLEQERNILLLEKNRLDAEVAGLREKIALLEKEREKTIDWKVHRIAEKFIPPKGSV